MKNAANTVNHVRSPATLYAAAQDGAFDRWFEVMTRTDPHSGEQSQPSGLLNRLGGMSVQTSEATRSFAALQGLTMKFHSQAIAFSQRKCFFTTKCGYFGTCPDPLPMPLQDGDRIAVVSGLEMPLLLRPVGAAFKLLTHVYVHGIMHGEAWPDKDEDFQEIRPV